MFVLQGNCISNNNTLYHPQHCYCIIIKTLCMSILQVHMYLIFSYRHVFNVSISTVIRCSTPVSYRIAPLFTLSQTKTTHHVIILVFIGKHLMTFRRQPILYVRRFFHFEILRRRKQIAPESPILAPAI